MLVTLVVVDATLAASTRALRHTRSADCSARLAQPVLVTLQVHNDGKAVVTAGSRESMEVDVSKLHAAGLWATLQQDR